MKREIVLMINLDSLFDTLMKDTQKSRNNRVSKILNQRDIKSKNSSELQLIRRESKPMELSDSNEYTWDVIGESIK